MQLLAIILTNKRITLIFVLCFVVFCQLWQAQSLSKKLKAAQDKCNSEKQSIIEKHKQASEKAANDLLEMSQKYEAERLKEKVIYNAEKHEVKEIIRDNVIYRDCKLDDRMQQKLREATTPK